MLESPIEDLRNQSLRVFSQCTIHFCKSMLFYKKSILKSSAKSVGKHLMKPKARGLQFHFKNTLAQGFSQEFCEIFNSN